MVPLHLNILSYRNKIGPAVERVGMAAKVENGITTANNKKQNGTRSTTASTMNTIAASRKSRYPMTLLRLVSMVKELPRIMMGRTNRK